MGERHGEGDRDGGDRDRQRPRSKPAGRAVDPALTHWIQLELRGFHLPQGRRTDGRAPWPCKSLRASWKRRGPCG